LGAQRFTTNGLETIRVLGPSTGLATNFYLLQGTTNLVNWVPLQTNRLPTALTNFVDPDRGKFPYRFYRLVPYPPLDWLR